MTTRNTAPRFMQNNQAAAPGATLSASTAKSGFPVANVVDEYRYKRLIFTGCFRVTAANKTLYIDDGTEKTVTLTEGVYATAALLAAHVQTQLNASSTNWTATYSSSTYKYTLGRSSGTAILRLSETADAAWDMLGYVGAVDDDVGTGQAADEVRIHTSERIDIDLGAAKEILAFIVNGQADEDFPISESAVMTLKGDDLEASLDGTPTVSVSLSREDSGIVKFLDDLEETTLRYWRWEFQDRTNPNGPEIQIAQVYLGDYVTPLVRKLSNGFKHEYVDPSVVSKSAAGVPFWEERPIYSRFESVTFAWLSGSDRTELARVIREMRTTRPFFFALDPTVSFSATVGEFTKYVTFVDQPSLTHIRANKYQISMQMEEVLG